jgi:hypothetical protein
MNVVQDTARTTREGGVTGRGFMPGQSGNPGGRPKGLGRRVREGRSVGPARPMRGVGRCGAWLGKGPRMLAGAPCA